MPRARVRPIDGPGDWEVAFGLYEISGSIDGQPVTPIQGTLELREDRWLLTTDSGSCTDESLPLYRQGPSLTLYCPTQQLVVRRTDDGLDTRARMTIEVLETVRTERCHIDNRGNRVCTPSLETRKIRRTGNISLRRLASDLPARAAATAP